MGTRSTTKIYEDGRLVLALYKQYDGYIESGWGEELKEFIKSGVFVKGINPTKLGKKKFMFNGIRDFALQLVIKFKEGCGGLYATTEDDEQEYNYIIDFIWGNAQKNKSNKLLIKCKEEPKFNEVIDLGVY